MNNNDEELLQAFIGKNYEKIIAKKFNIWGFLFNLFYVFYRKMTWIGTLIIFIVSIVATITNNTSPLTYAIINGTVFIAISVILGIYVNTIYIDYSKNIIAKIKASNPDKSTEELKNICATIGGTSIIDIFHGILVLLIINFTFGLIIGTIESTTGITNLFN